MRSDAGDEVKAWPAILAERYPLPPVAFPDRPWWGAGWIRRDGRIVAGVFREDADHTARIIDDKYPLPFPGIRVGQTWAVNVTDADASVFTITEFDKDYMKEWTGGADRPSPWFAGGSWIDSTELVDLCRSGFLLADQVCPWLAPWAGV